MTVRLPAVIALLAFAVIAANGCGGKEDESRTPEGLPVIGTAAIDSFITAGGISLIEFGGKHCGPCKTMRGRLRAYMNEHTDLRVVCVYWETDPESFKRFDVGSVPAQLVFDASGKEIARHVGVWENTDLHQAIESARLQDRTVER